MKTLIFAGFTLVMLLAIVLYSTFLAAFASDDKTVTIAINRAGEALIELFVLTAVIIFAFIAYITSIKAYIKKEEKC